MLLVQHFNQTLQYSQLLKCNTCNASKVVIEERACKTWWIQ